MLSTYNLQHLRYNFLEVIIFIYQGRGGGDSVRQQGKYGRTHSSRKFVLGNSMASELET